MSLFASLWWVWLLGLLVCAGYGAYKWVQSILQTPRSFVRAANYTLEGIEIVADENKTISDKAAQARTRVLEELFKEGFDRLNAYVIGFWAFCAAAVFALLLVLSIVFMIILRWS